jgi:phosphate transport system permease protein
MSDFLKSVRRGDPMIWFTGAALGMCILMIVGLVLVVLVNGLSFFWPKHLERLTLKEGAVFLGEIVNREPIPNPGHPDHLERHRVQLRVGNRDLYGFDFKWVDEDDVASRDLPEDAFFVERREYGPLLGTPMAVKQGETVVAEGAGAAEKALAGLLEKAARDRRAIERIEKHEIGDINFTIERGRLEIRARENPERDLSKERAEVARIAAAQEALFRTKTEELAALMEKAGTTYVTFRTADGGEKELRSLDIYRAYPANKLGLPGRLSVYASRLWEFFSGDPRESNTEGGIFPAIFGTVMMVILMSIVVVPLGVLAALYMREYARQGALVRTVRIAVNNLAGVPSIVFGVFGLGFFCYTMGASIDQVFYADALPNPTYGKGGVLWSSLTLALLTLPVVIVATEESLSAVPNSLREGSYACGASKWQTIRRIVLPRAMPGIMTGMILAMARGAGEVAPLMLVGAVKLAPELPLDRIAPFVHPERSFMHLGFHVFDLGFQSQNSEAAKPMVFTTTLLLIAIVFVLNVLAVRLRARLRRKFVADIF